MKKLSDFIVRKRNLILLIAVLLLIPSAIVMHVPKSIMTY